MTILWSTARAHAAGHREVSVDEAHGHTTGLRVIDVREPSEFRAELGHIAGAELVPLSTVGGAACRWDKADELLLVCRSGARSGRAAAQLAAAGFTHVINLSGGMLAWNEGRLPTER